MLGHRFVSILVQLIDISTNFISKTGPYSIDILCRTVNLWERKYYNAGYEAVTVVVVLVLVNTTDKMTPPHPRNHKYIMDIFHLLSFKYIPKTLVDSRLEWNSLKVPRSGIEFGTMWLRSVFPAPAHKCMNGFYSYIVFSNVA